MRQLRVSRGQVQDPRHALPPEPVGRRVGVRGPAEVPQREGGEAGAQPAHALVVDLFAHEGGVAAVDPPPEAFPAGDGFLVAGDAEQGRADDVVFGPEHVDQALPVPAVGGDGEDGDEEDADAVGRFGLHAGFLDQLGNGGFGEAAEEVEKAAGVSPFRCRG